MQRGLLLALLVVLPLLLRGPPAQAAPFDDCGQDIARHTGPPLPVTPPQPVQIYPGIPCPLKRFEPPPPSPGEDPTVYAKRVVLYYVCMDFSQTPPGVEVSDQCGPWEGLPLL